MKVSDSMKEKMELFSGTGRVIRENEELFAENGAYR